jgi:hypothetical protein
VLRAPQTNPDHAFASNWRASSLRGGTPGTTDTLPLPTDPTGDANLNGLSDLIDYAMGNDLGAVPIPAGFALQPGSSGSPATYLVNYPVSLGAEGAVIKVLFSTNLVDWEDGMGALTGVSMQPLGEGRALVTWRVNPPFSEAPRLFMRLQVTAQ